MPTFRVTEMPYYRKGHLYQPGERVTLPDGERPAPHWVPLDGPDAAPEAPESPPKDAPAPKGGPQGKGQRPSDKSPV